MDVVSFIFKPVVHDNQVNEENVANLLMASFVTCYDESEDAR